MSYIDQGSFLMLMGMGALITSQLTARIAMGRIAIKTLLLFGFLLSLVGLWTTTWVATRQQLLWVGLFVGIGNCLFSMCNTVSIGLPEKN